MKDHLTTRLAETDALLNEAERGRPSLLDLASAAGLDLVPGVGAVLQRLSDAVRDQRIAHLAQAARRLVDVLAVVHEDVRRRLETDRGFALFVERLIVESLRAEQREKIEYYARLLERSAPESGPDEDERVRLLDVLDGLRPHHLRLFAAAANTEAVPAEIERLGNVWETLRHASGTDPETAQRDWAVLERLDLVRAGWTSTVNTRLALTEFGLRFEAFVAAAHPRTHPRWEVELVANGDALASLLTDFASAGREPHVTREEGGHYIVSASFDELADADEVRRSADAFLARVAMARWLADEDLPGEARTGRIRESRDGQVLIHEPATPAATPPEPEYWYTPPLAPLAERLMNEDPVVAQVMAAFGERSWPSLVRCLNTIEREIGGELSGYPGFVGEDLQRFNAEARNRGLDRPPGSGPAAMGLDQATAAVRQVVRIWLYVRAGLWPAPAEHGRTGE